jgi:hypothetical protein
VSDSSDIDSALVAKLQGDPTLAGLMPGGVFVDEAPAGLTQFVIVSLVDAVDVAKFGGRAFEDALVLVKAVEKKPATGSGNIKAAAARIDAVLEDAVLTVAGYTPMACYREARVRTTEVDEIDPSIRWFHRGGHYRVQQSL